MIMEILTGNLALVAQYEPIGPEFIDGGMASL